MRKARKVLAVLAVCLILILAVSTVALAATYEHYFPVVIEDTSGTARENTPVLLGFAGSNFNTSGFMNATGTDTNVQQGANNAEYMMSTTQVPVFVSDLPANGLVTYNFYTGYSPVQTAFDILVGDGGYITTSDAAALEVGNSFNIQQKGWIDTSSGSDKNLVYKEGAFRTYISAANSITSSIQDTVTTPTVEAVNGGGETSDGTNHTVNLPSGIVSGNLLIVLFASDSNPTITFPAGDWTQLFDTASSTDARLGCWYRIADGSEGATIVVTTDTSQMTSHTSYRIDNYTGTPEVGTAATGNSTSPDPPSLTPSWGAKNNLWLAVCGHDNGTTTVSAYPANYTDGRNDRGNNVGGCGIGSARRELNAVSEDPGVFTISASNAWIANTVAIKAGYGDGTDTVTATGISSGEHEVKTTHTGTELRIFVDNMSVPEDWTATVDAVPDNANDWLIMQNNVMPYMEYYHHTVSGTLIVDYQPTVMITGTTLPDEEGAAQNGTITWGSNTDITITYGTMHSFAATSLSGTAVELGYDAPTMPMPTEWFSTGGSITTLPFYDMLNGISGDIGMPVQTMYMGILLSTAIALAVFIMAITGSMLAGIGIIATFMLIGSAMTIIPVWIVFVFMVVSCGVMYLTRAII